MEMSRDLATLETSQICQESCLMPEAISCAPIDGTGIAVELWRLPGQQAEDEGEAGASKQRDKEDIPGEEAQKQERDMTAEEKLVLKEFPAWKEQLEAGIQKLQVLADHVDNTHQTLARASLLTSLVAVFSGALGILGLLLGPAATGGSLLLSVASRGLGTAAGATSMLTGMLAHLHTQGVRVLARSLVSSSGQGAPESRGSKASCFLAMGKLACNGGSALWEVRKLVRAFQEVRAHPHLVSGGPGSRQVHRATGSSALVAAYSLGLDLLQGWRQPQEDMELALAEELRAWACRLQQELAELTQLQEHLQKKPSQGERTLSASPEGAMGTLSLAWQEEEGQQVPGEDGSRLSPAVLLEVAHGH